MGVHFSHCDASWAYSGFNRARTKLAACIGMTLDDMQGFERPWDKHTSPSIPWPDKDPINLLLSHSDCDGVLTPEQCVIIVPRLRELIQFWPNDNDKQNFLMLAQGMDEAIKANEDLEFC